LGSFSPETIFVRDSMLMRLSSTRSALVSFLFQVDTKRLLHRGHGKRFMVSDWPRLLVSYKCFLRLGCLPFFLIHHH